jgi:2-polyprenyl-3-methyl-5-hydroxy-6-metoxy-1,4-benzoquinol methylase
VYRDIVTTLRDAGVGKVFDIGVGNGYFSELLVRSGFDVTGIDKDLSKTRKDGPRQSSCTVRFVRGDFTKYASRQTFHAATCLFVLHALSAGDRARVVQRAKELVRGSRQGILIVVDYERPSSKGLAACLWYLLKLDEKSTGFNGASDHYRNFQSNTATSLNRQLDALTRPLPTLVDKTFLLGTIRLLVLTVNTRH